MTEFLQSQLNEARSIAEKHHGQLLSTQYSGLTHALEFKLQSGEVFRRSLGSLRLNGWPTPEKSLTPGMQLDKLRRIATVNNGKLLSDKWIGTQNVYSFQFADGRCFEMTAAQMTSKRASEGWPKKPDRFLATDESRFQDLVDLAAANGGKIHEQQWLGAAIKHKIELSNGQIIEILPCRVLPSSWPDTKNYQTPGMLLSKIRKIAEDHKGRLITEKWLGAKTLHLFSFENGETFSRTPDNMNSDIKKGYSGWPIDQAAYMKTDEHHLDQLREIAIARGGKLLSTVWIGNNELYEFEDEAEMKFKATAHNVKAGSWSPYAGLITEPLCRQIMEHLFGAQFPNSMDILTPSLTGSARSWELDGYCEPLQMAFEYQGFQSHWDPSYPSYLETAARDAEKIRICDALSIFLVVIPCVPMSGAMWGMEKMMAHIMAAIQTACERTGRQLSPMNTAKFEPNFHALHRCVRHLTRLRDIAEANGGQLLSTVWLGSSATYDFQKSDGTPFSRSAGNLHTYGWPQPPVLKDKSAFMEEMRSIAAKNGGTLASPEWLGARIRHTFAFADGRTFEMTLGQLKMPTGGWPKEEGRYLHRNGQTPPKEKDIPKFSRK